MKRIIFIFCLFCLWACNENSKEEVIPFLTCEQERIVFNKETQVKSLPCETNMSDLRFSFDREGEKWCRGTFAEGKLMFEVQENTSLQPRETIVTVGNADIFIKITVFQAGIEPVLILDPDKQSILLYGGTVQTVVSTNVEYEVTVTKGTDWITPLPVETGKKDIRKFRIAVNNTQADRIGTVTFRQKEGSLKSILTITQRGPQYTAEMKVPFGKMGFIEPLWSYAKRLKEGIREWHNEEALIKFFVNVAGQPQADDSLFMEVTGHAYEDANLELQINGKVAGTLQVKEGDFRLALPAFVPPASNYQCISFKGMDGPKHYPDLDTMVIRYRPGLELNYETTTYGAMSVHLGYDVTNEDIEWSLGEVMVKPEACRPDIYYMVSDFFGGYSGIQVNNEKGFDLNNPLGQTFLFSVWSDYNTDNPEEIPDNYQPWTDEIGENVRNGNFGNEGSGVHANWDYKWRPNAIYKFLIHYERIGKVRRNGKDYPNCNAYTCWIYVPEKDEWVFFVRYIRPNDKRTHLGRPGSFVENPGGSNGSSKYKAYFRHWIRYKGANTWTALDHYYASGNADHPRYDYGWGKERIEDENDYGGEFCYLFSGGFTVNTGKKGPERGELNITQVPDVNLATLPYLDRFDNLQSGETEEIIVDLDQTHWSATASSEESDGIARYAIDGNMNTKWHTLFTGSQPWPGYPHWIQIDMQKTEKFIGFIIQPSGWHVPKNFQVELSENGETWTLLGQYILENTGYEQQFLLDEARSARHVKITFMERGYTDDVFTEIREIRFFKYSETE